jgi:CPA1 family monovalent cation:H+ antiporter
MSYSTVARWGGAKVSTAGATVVAWCGMRGIVTLAAALALPEGGSAGFPYRDFILFTAFSVVLGTLVVQGMTVGPLMKLLALRDDGSVDREVRLARAETARAALTAVDGTTGDGGGGAGEMIGFLRRKYQARLLRAEKGDDALDPAEADGWRDFGGMQRRAFAEERRRLSDLRARGVIGDDAFHRVEEELDWAQVNAESRRL